jgi:hypothetical protein
MTELTESYLTVQYSLRPAKQVERRILVDALHLLAEAGFPVRDYCYTGMGSIHFIDFAMFHKYLGIRDMLSVELSAKIERRVRFNTPYRNAVKVETGKPIGDFISELKKDSQHVLWLDYDNVLSNFMLRDLSLAATELPIGSILLVTVDTEPPGKLPSGIPHTRYNYNARHCREYFESIAHDYLTPNKGDEDFDYDQLPRMNVRAIRGAIETGRGNALDKEFQPLFNFLYADGHRMMTLGGILLDASKKRQLRRSKLMQADYVRTSFDEPPFRIIIPPLTRKEQTYLDENMPRKGGWHPQDFELSEEAVDDYARIYRFFPTYAELFL